SLKLLRLTDRIAFGMTRPEYETRSCIVDLEDCGSLAAEVRRDCALLNLSARNLSRRRARESGCFTIRPTEQKGCRTIEFFTRKKNPEASRTSTTRTIPRTSEFGF